MKTIIVGAGISGVFLAKELDQSIILEKSGALGGRLAARRLSGITFSYGPEKLQLPWINHSIINPHAWIRAEAQDLQVLKKWEVSNFTFSDNEIGVSGTEGQYLEGNKIILTAPAPQTKAILERSGLKADFLADVEYSSKIQFMLLSNSVIDSTWLEKYMICVRAKPLEDGQYFFLYEIKEEFLNEFMNMDKEAIKDFFLRKISDDVLDCHVHKWRYSEVRRSISPEIQLFYKNKGIFLAGDYFGNEGAKSSFESIKKVILNLPKSLRK